MEFIGDDLATCIHDIQSQLPADAMTEFKKLTTDEDRFLFAWRLAGVQTAMQLPEAERSEKSTCDAVKHRNQGNAFFQKKSYMNAIDEYNKSIRSGPVKLSKHAKGKQELALAYGNRSAALMHLKRYELSLRDTELALDHGYPEELKYKLYDRRGKCYLQQCMATEATESFMRAAECLKAAKLEDGDRDKWSQTINRQVVQAEEIAQRNNTGKAKGDRPMDAKVPKLSGEPNATYPHASAAVSITWDDSKGRHAVASKDITVGDVLVAEKPYAFVLLPEFYSTHCYNCLCRVLAPVACEQCTTVVFCSKQCRVASWQSHHQYECHCMTLLAKTWCGDIGHLAVRMVMVGGWQEVLNYKRNVRKGVIQSGEKDLQGLDQAGVYASDYHSIFNLVINAKLRTADGLFDFTIFSVFLMKVLQLSKFLPDGDNALNEKRTCLLGGVLLRHLQILQCNACGIRELLHPLDFEDLKPVNIGSAVYATASLLNHSCDANTDFVYFKDYLTTRATRNIRKGEEISCDYGASFVHNGSKERYLALKCRYSFECKCHACENKWPEWSKLDEEFPVFQCPDCQVRLPTFDLASQKKKAIKCKKCHTSQDMAEVVGQLQASHDVYGQGMQEALGCNAEDALPKLVQHLILLQKYTKMPWRDTVACQQAVRNCYRLLGNIRQ